MAGCGVSAVSGCLVLGLVAGGAHNLASLKEATVIVELLEGLGIDVLGLVGGGIHGLVE